MTNGEAACTEAARDQFLPELEQLLSEPLKPLKTQPDQQWLEFVVDAASHSPVILFHYPTTQPSGYKYLKRSVKLELGTLPEQRPVGKHPIRPWLAVEFPQLFPEWDFDAGRLHGYLFSKNNFFHVLIVPSCRQSFVFDPALC